MARARPDPGVSHPYGLLHERLADWDEDDLARFAGYLLHYNAGYEPPAGR